MDKIKEERAKRIFDITKKLKELREQLASVKAEEAKRYDGKQAKRKSFKERVSVVKDKRADSVSQLIDATRADNGPIKSAEENLKEYDEWLNKVKQEEGQQTDNEQESDGDR